MSARRAAAALIACAVVLALLASTATAADPVVESTSGAAAVGETATIELHANDIPEPGLGAWTIDVMYDFDVAEAVACTTVQLGQCNTEYATGTVRVSGASATGLSGDVALASIQLRCDAPAATAVQVAVRVLAAAAEVNPETIDAALSSGTLTCGAQATQTPLAAAATPTAALAGFGTGGGAVPGGAGLSDLMIAGLAGAGIAWMIAGVVGIGWSRLTASAATAAPHPRIAASAGPDRRAAPPRPAASKPSAFPSLPALIEPPDTFLTRGR